ncbi:MAG: DsbA family protein [Anaerolineaceae bacterium]|nr:DsbA family protein [Anaerolineaceae bacterium]
MSSKRASRTKQRSSSRRNGSSGGLKTYGLIIGVVVVVIAVVAAIAVFGGGNPPPAPTPEASFDKSEGAADAPVVVVEYADFQCPYCREFATGPERQLKQDYIDQGLVRYVFHHMAFIGDESRWAAAASECANDQGRFWDYHDKLFASQTGENVGDFSYDNLKRFAAELNLDTQQFNQCLDSGQHQAKVQQEVTAAQQSGVTSTPTLFVNGQLIKQASNYQVLQRAIDAALNR